MLNRCNLVHTCLIHGCGGVCRWFNERIWPWIDTEYAKVKAKNRAVQANKKGTKAVDKTAEQFLEVCSSTLLLRI